MTETARQAERPGHAAEDRRVLTLAERDELVALVTAYADAEADAKAGVATGVLTGEDRRALTNDARTAYKAFIDRLYALSKLPTLEDLDAYRARLVAHHRADAPRAAAPVEVVAEARECKAKRYALGVDCSPEGARFDVVYRQYPTERASVLDRHAACWVHGLAEVDRHHKSAGIAFAELVEVKP